MNTSLTGLGFSIEFGGVLQAAREVGMDVTRLCGPHGEGMWRERSELWARIMRELRFDGLPIRVAQQMSVGALGPLGMAAQTAPNLRSAYERLIHYQHALSGMTLARMRDDASRGTTVIEHIPLGEADLGWRCRREMMVAVAYKNGSDLAGGRRVRPLRVCFLHAEPRDTSEHEAFFDCEVRFGADYDGLEYDRDSLAIPLAGADGDLSQFLIEHLHAIAGDPPAATSALEARVRRAIRGRIGKQTLSMDLLATDLGMSTRTLRRRLVEHRTTYRAILDDVRREVADELLADSGYRVSEVCFLLGFSEPSAFHRAYVRWTGRTPAVSRRVA